MINDALVAFNLTPLPTIALIVNNGLVDLGNLLTTQSNAHWDMNCVASRCLWLIMILNFAAATPI
jgi:hypothetical protein